MNLKKYINFFYLKYVKKCTVQKNIDIRGFLYVKNNGQIFIDDNFVCNSGIFKNPIGGDHISRFVTRTNGNIRIGKNVGISNSTLVSAIGIYIDDNVMIGGGSKIWDTNFHSIDPHERRIKKEVSIKSKPIQLKENCFIGGGCTILPGVIVGKNSVVGAGSVVRNSVPDNEIWAGNPAIKIRKI